MREQRQLLPLTDYTYDTDTVALDFSVPTWAVGAAFLLTVASMSGTAETVDLKIQHLLPYSATALDVVGASIVQITAAASRVITVDPRVTAAANAAIALPLTSNMRALISLGGSTDEAYNLGLAVEFYS